jgi:hypothetical protein
MTNGSWWAPITVMAITIILIRIHPEPADACCKCFEDGVAFAGVFVGVKFGQWRNPAMHSASVHGLAAAPIALILIKMVVKIVLGTLFASLLTWQGSHFCLLGEPQQNPCSIESYLPFTGSWRRQGSICPVDTL